MPNEFEDAIRKLINANGTGEQTMNKQIEDMAKVLCQYATSEYCASGRCVRTNCLVNAKALEILCANGYRKSTDVAREIFDGVMQAIEEGTKNATSTLKQSITTHEKLLVSTGEMYSGFVGKAICQFFKKYESEGADDK